jgi:tRNA-dihydrouridine synthase B
MRTKLETLGVSFPFFVAPMVNVSHVAFRELVRSYTPPSLSALLFTEMLSSRRIPNEHLEEAEALRCSVGESCFIPQLLGNEERFIAPSVEKLLKKSPWGFDINMGCPAKKTLGHNWGVLLMGDREYAASIVSITKKYSTKPVSVKLRAGTGREADIPYLLDFTKALEDAGADWLTLHCRTREQRHRGRADWNVVREVAQVRNIPVVGNGDIQTAEDALSLVNDYGVDGAMIARAATARPWILWQIAERLGLSETPVGFEGRKPPATPVEEGEEYFRAIIRFIGFLEEYYGESKRSLMRFKTFVGINHRWLNFGHHFWKTVIAAKTLEEAREITLRYQEQYPQTMSPRINL